MCSVVLVELNVNERAYDVHGTFEFMRNKVMTYQDEKGVWSPLIIVKVRKEGKLKNSTQKIGGGDINKCHLVAKRRVFRRAYDV
jgi:hypothetical protein